MIGRIRHINVAKSINRNAFGGGQGRGLGGPLLGYRIRPRQSPNRKSLTPNNTTAH